MPEETLKPNLVQVENRKMVRDMRSKAILNRDKGARAAYMKRRAFRQKKSREMAQLKIENTSNRSEIAALRAQVEALIRMMDQKTTTKKTATRRKKSEDS